MWCDAGPGTFVSLPFSSDLITAVVVSHVHPDHCADLLAAYHAWTYRPDPREPVPLFAPQSVWDRVCGFIGKEPDCYAFTPVVGGDEHSLGPIDIGFVDMDHSAPTVGSRWTANNRTLFYTGDTGPAGNWRAAARDVHLMLSEASLQGTPNEKEVSQHLTASEAGAIAREVHAEDLVLTHIPPYLDKSVSVAEAEETFGKPVRLAVPGTYFDV